MSQPYVAFTAQRALLQGTRVLTTDFRGVLRVQEDELVLEFTTQRTLAGGGSGVFVVTTGGSFSSLLPDEDDGTVHSVRIPLEHVGSLELRGGVLMPPQLDIEVNRLGALAGLPWSNGSRVRIKLARRDARRARELAVDVRLRLADASLRRLGE